MTHEKLARGYAAINDLINWYWEYGVRRQGTYSVTGTWVYDAYRCLYSIESILELVKEDSRPSIAVWGPSQTGKSTMLSKIIDAPSKLDSALNWGEGQKYIFSSPTSGQQMFAETEGIEFPPTLNPFNLGSDGSAVVGRYFFARKDDITDVDYPVKMSLGSVGDILQTLATGYLKECDTTLIDGSERIWTEGTLNDILPDFEPSRKTASNKDAMELIISLVQVVDHFVGKSQYNRFNNLNKNNLWKTRLRDEILSNYTLVTSKAAALDFIGVFLWDDSFLLNSLSEDLLRMRSYVVEKAGGKPLYISLSLAGVLFDMDFTSLSKERCKSSEAMSMLRSLSIQSRGGISVLEQGGAHGEFFKPGSEAEYVYQIGLLQACCWELAVPLNKDFDMGIDESVRKPVFEMNILDIPGVSKVGEGDKDVKLSSNSATSDPRVFSNLIKKGKTFSVINKYAREYKIDALLLLLRSSEALSQPGLLTEGIKTILESIDSEYSLGKRDELPIPLSINLTFFMKVLKDAGQGFPHYDFVGLEKHLNPLGKLASVENCYSFATNYPDLPDGEATTSWSDYAAKAACVDNKSLLSKFFGRYESAEKWIEGRFTTSRERESLYHVLDSDGGVGNLFHAQSELINSGHQEKRIESLIANNVNTLYRLVSEVSPDQEDDGVRATEAILKIREFLIAQLEELSSEMTMESYEGILNLSSCLRTVFSCDADELQSVINTSSSYDISMPEVFLKRLLNQWAKSAKRSDALVSLNVSARDVPIVLDALSNTLFEKREKTLDWLGLWFDPSNSGESFDSKNNALRYLAAYIAKEIKKGMSAYQGIEYESRRLHCEAKFNDWRDNKSLSHIELVLKPFIEYLEELAPALGGSLRAPQDGDGELLKISDAYEMKTNDGVLDNG